MRVSDWDQTAFVAQIETYRKELHVHCYRLMGSIHDADDMVQETLLRAWRRRETIERPSSLRAWLYTIATNICLDALKRRPKRSIPPHTRRSRPSRNRSRRRSSSRFGSNRTRTRSSVPRTSSIPKSWLSRAKTSPWRSSSSCTSCRPDSVPCSSYETYWTGQQARSPHFSTTTIPAVKLPCIERVPSSPKAA